MSDSAAKVKQSLTSADSGKTTDPAQTTAAVANAASVPDYDLRPVQNEAGTWDALDAQGYGHVLEFPTAEWVETWIDGYNTGARENT